MSKIRNFILEQVASKNLSKVDAAKMLEELFESNFIENNDDDIAIIGMACRFPKANSIYEFWDNLCNDMDAVDKFPTNRIKDIESVVEKELEIQADEAKYIQGGYLEGIDLFDNEIFNITPGEAKLIDPQQRIFLEVVLEAIEDAGYSKDAVYGSKTGVYVGYSDSQYSKFIPYTEPSSVPGNLAAVIASRVSYFYNFTGPAQMIDTTCSSSLVAVHEACHAIRAGDCEMAIVGGVKLNLLPVDLSDYGVRTEASDSRCKAFDESADGIGSGEGAGVIILKSLKRAKEDRECIRAIIKGSAVNSDGRSNGITAPNALAQASVLKEAWERAGIEPDTISYIEAHGTGTKLGDPIEIEGLTNAFNCYTQKKQICPIGSVKTNIGHLDSAAGIASMIKVILSLENKYIPASLHFKKANPLIDFKDSAVYVNSMLTKWETSHLPRRSGVSSFGLSGTNCHVVLEEYIQEQDYEQCEDNKEHIFTLSAKSEEALVELIEKYIIWLDKSKNNLGDICYTVNIGRTQFSNRIAVVTDSIQDLKIKLGKICKLKREGNISETAKCTKVYFTGIDKQEINDLSDLEKLALDYIHLVQFNLHEMYSDCKYSKIHLPAYAFQRKRFWVEYKRNILIPSVNESVTDNLDMVPIFESTFKFGEELINTICFQRAEGLDDAVNEFCCVLIMEFFKSFGLFTEIGHTFTLNQIIDRIGVIPAFEKLCIFMLNVLKHRNILTEENSQYILESSYKFYKLSSIFEEYTCEYPKYKDIFVLLRHCFSMYPDAITGKINPLNVLYPSGNQDFLKQLDLESDELANSYSLIALEAINKYIQSIKGRQVRVLEVGAGAGSFTEKILPRINDKNVEYYFTDIGNYFLTNAKDKFKEYPFVKYKLYNIENDPVEQGFKNGYFDIVAGLNVVHATRNIRNVLKKLKSLLKQDGILAIMEDVKNANWTTLVWGLTAGWWYFEDTDLRVSSPLLNIPKWEKVFNDVGFKKVLSYPEDKVKRVLTENALIVGQNSDTVKDWLYKLNWIEKSAGNNDRNNLYNNGLWLICRDQIGIGDSLAGEMHQLGYETVIIDAGETFNKTGNGVYTINPVSQGDLQALLTSIGAEKVQKIAGILHLWTCTKQRDDKDVQWEQYCETQETGVFSLYTMVKGILSVIPKNSLEIRIVSNYVYDILRGSDKYISPDKATIWGMSRVIHQEFPKISCYCMDVDTEYNNIQEIVGNIISEMSIKRDNRDYTVGYRANKRYVQQVERLDVNSISNRVVDVREDGIYIITGGAGYLGIRTCYYLAKRAKAKFILINRTKLPDREKWYELLKTLDKNNKLYYQITNILEIEKLGSTVHLYTADASKSEQMIEVIRKVKSRYGAINGIVNATMLINRKKIMEMTLDELKDAVNSKIRVTMILDDVTKNENLDFFILFSSISSILGGATRSDCAASNLFIDTYGEFRNKKGKQTTILNLPGISVDKVAKEEQEQAAWPTMSGNEFEEAFDTIIRKNIEFVIFEDFDFQEVKRILPFVKFQFSEELLGDNNPMSFNDESISRQPNEMQLSKENAKAEITEVDDDSIDQKVLQIWSEVLGYEEIGLEDDFFEIGGDSLMAIKILDLIKAKFDVEMEVSQIFTYSTISKLAGYLKTLSNKQDSLMELLRTMEDGNISVEDVMKKLK